MMDFPYILPSRQRRIRIHISVYTTKHKWSNAPQTVSESGLYDRITIHLGVHLHLHVAMCLVVHLRSHHKKMHFNTKFKQGQKTVTQPLKQWWQHQFCQSDKFLSLSSPSSDKTHTLACWVLREHLHKAADGHLN